MCADTIFEHRPSCSPDNADDVKKTKTFAIPTPLAQWFNEVVYEDATGVVKKEWLYDQYVKFCRERGTFRPKHKQIFSKLVFTVFPRAGSCRLGSIGNQVPYYFGIKRRKTSQKEDGKASFLISTPQTRSTIGKEAEMLNRLSWNCENKENSRIMGLSSMQSCGKRKRDSKEEVETSKKFKAEEEEKEEDEENPSLTGEQMKQRLMSLHRLLAPQEADPYQVDVESYVDLFVEQFWPELSPLQWDLSGEETLSISEQEMNSFALCLCTSLFCGSLVKNDIQFAKETLMLCSSLVNALVLQLKVAGTPERLQKNFGVSLLFLARGLVDCSLFQNDIEAVVLAKNYCAMAAEIFP